MALPAVSQVLSVAVVHAYLQWLLPVFGALGALMLARVVCACACTCGEYNTKDSRDCDRCLVSGIELAHVQSRLRLFDAVVADILDPEANADTAVARISVVGYMTVAFDMISAGAILGGNDAYA